MEHKVKKLIYENALGVTELRNPVLDMEQDQIVLYKQGTPIEDLDYGLSGADIEKAEREIALRFYKEKYQNIMSGVYEPERDEIMAIQNFLGLNKLQFAKIIGLGRGSLVNVYKRNSCSHPVQILIMERMGMELARKGSAKAMYNAMSQTQNPDDHLSETDPEINAEISDIRYGHKVA